MSLYIRDITGYKGESEEVTQRVKRRLLSLGCTLIMLAGIIMISAVDSQAASDVPMIDGSYLTHEDESVGCSTKMTRGEDLLVGYSKCVEVGPGKFYGGGSTIAVQTVEKVGVGVSVERAKKGDDHWTGYRGWMKFNHNADRVSSSKMLDVEGGYYYRVSCIHSAGNDVSSSFTDGVYIEEP